MFAFCGHLHLGQKCGLRLAEMIALGIALIVAGLTLVCGSGIFRFFGTEVPASYEASLVEEPFRINDEMWRQPDELLEDGSVPAEYAPTDRKRRDK
jgi:hypothetical protein